MKTKSEIDAGAQALQKLARTGRGITLDWVAAREGAIAVLNAAANVVRRNTIEQQERLDDFRN